MLGLELRYKEHCLIAQYLVDSLSRELGKKNKNLAKKEFSNF